MTTDDGTPATDAEPRTTPVGPPAAGGRLADDVVWAARAPIDRAFARPNHRPSIPVIDKSRTGIAAPADYAPAVIEGDGPAAASARSALGALHAVWKEVGDAARNPNVPAPELARVGQAAVERALRRADTASETIAREVKAAEQALEAKIAPKIEGGIASEIRQHWAQRLSGRGEKLGELLAVVRQDVRTSGAILCAPAYLSGLSAEQLEMVRVQAIEAHAPAEGAKLQGARRVAEVVERASRRLIEELGPRLKRWSGGAAPLAKLEGLGRE